MRTQRLLTHILKPVAAVFVVSTLGFMTHFYVLFIEGTDDMFTFYKELQSFNNLMFGWGLAVLVASFVPIFFDLHKRTAGVFGVGFTIFYAGAAAVLALVFRAAAQPYIAAYRGFDFSALEGFQPSLAPFRLTQLAFGLVVLVAVALSAVTIANFIRERRQEQHS